LNGIEGNSSIKPSEPKNKWNRRSVGGLCWEQALDKFSELVLRRLAKSKFEQRFESHRHDRLGGERRRGEKRRVGERIPCTERKFGGEGASVEEEDAFTEQQASPRERGGVGGKKEESHKDREFPRVEANLTNEISNDT
jgi:hypothetical protein